MAEEVDEPSTLTNDINDILESFDYEILLDNSILDLTETDEVSSTTATTITTTTTTTTSTTETTTSRETETATLETIAEAFADSVTDADDFEVTTRIPKEQVQAAELLPSSE